ncbi:VOC family protein [Rhodococcus opacus]|nr:VOC family protein [Rhodococcus opacus]
MLELDHIFCMVDPDDDWDERLTAAGVMLDAGRSHPGQGTRNRRIVWPEQYLELLWVEDWSEAAANPLRLDRRSDWVASGASPFGFGFRGQIPVEQRDEFWLYDRLPMRVWVHRDNERFPARPMLFVLDVDPADKDRHRGRHRLPEVPSTHSGPLREVRVWDRATTDLPAYSGPPVRQHVARSRIELLLGNSDIQNERTVEVTPLLCLHSAR